MDAELKERDFDIQASIVTDIDEWASRAAIFVGARLRPASDAGEKITTELVGSAQDAAAWLVRGLLEHGRMVGEDHRALLSACRDMLQRDEDLEQRVRAETEAQVAEAAAQECLKLAEAESAREWRLPRGMDRAIVEGRHGAACDLAGRIRAIAPADYVAVRAEDLAGVLRWLRFAGALPAMKPIDVADIDKLDDGALDRIRAALSRARKGE